MRVACYVAIGIAIPPVAYASAVTLDGTVGGVSPLAAMMVLVLSTLFGLAALLNVLKDTTPPRLLAYVGAHMLTSWGAGAIAFVIGEWRSWDDWFTVGMVMICSYGGVRVLDAVRDRLLKRIDTGSVAIPGSGTKPGG
jgi:hypothetical protein